LSKKQDIDANKERLVELQTILELEEAELKRTNDRLKDVLSVYFC
jgi:hypothetical protein